MTNEEIKKVGGLIYGSYWMSQVAKYLNVDRRRVSGWVNGTEKAPDNVEADLKMLTKRRLNEVLVALATLDNNLHEVAMLEGYTDNLDEDMIYTIEDIETFFDNQSVKILVEVKLRFEIYSLEEAFEWVDEEMLEENDISVFLEKIGAGQALIQQAKQIKNDKLIKLKKELTNLFEKKQNIE